VSLAARVDAARARGGPRFLDRRFNSAGQPVSCPGNTIIRHIADPVDLDRLSAAQDALRSGPAGSCFAWLPRESLHCTLFNGLLYAERETATWPTTLANDASRAEADAHIQDAFHSTPAPAGPVEMKIAGFSGFSSDALGLSLRADATGDQALRTYRDALAEAAGLRHRPGHDSYAFHITLGYLIAWPDPAVAAAFDAAKVPIAEGLASAPLHLPAHRPEFCTFEALDHFHVV